MDTSSADSPDTAGPVATDPELIARWQRYLANERAEEQVYRRLAAKKKSGEDFEILTALADAERRHQDHWIKLLGPHAQGRRRASFDILLLSWLARMFGSIFVLALAQGSESRSPYATDAHATPAMAADEQVHSEVVRALAGKARARISGNFRAAVFGANDGLVSNLALVLGVGAAGVGTHVVLLTGVSGLLAGAMSMAAGEFISMRSQRELLDAGHPDPHSTEALASLDVDANELALVFRARGMESAAAELAAQTAIGKSRSHRRVTFLPRNLEVESYEELGRALPAAAASFCFFASGALVPILPYILGMSGLPAVALATGLVGLALLFTGGVTGVLSGKAPLPRALRQLAVGYGAAAVTYVLGLAFGATAG
ncbi:VIT1/CCC1 family protein [Brevibacterium sp. 50QC2O2]|uniref:VIT1/CCC1 transporter family protein n=1 Tax=Brevibacterium TaxID=1696 RepID=UPI00211C2F40|nr:MULTISPECIES: VIT1/CCC1 family protein [unclassified Brevibacterium]MCQ9369300.1 VIT1/CCC1 family protein [Brevibacterium sp. 91QC2O2]MCQ9386682.1 VIT1/CCC1 family protein [Brevibacterium sp. 68QC2CO]MCQ9388695.1 VIT1/CCC1 family protein [Brevibacterium sp. 50QC2O2]